MTAPASQSVQLHCHHCQRWMGESATPLEFWGMFKDPRDREMVPGLRHTHRCKSCGWVNVFRSVESPSSARDWRSVELKQRTG